MAAIDLRSDTITHPPEGMREAMARALLGDDVFEEDPSINALQDRAAEMLGKEAGLFTASGTMGNLTALLAHTRPGDEVFLDEEAHIYYYEVGGLCRVAGLTPRLLAGDRGLVTAEALTEALRPQDIHFPIPRLLCLENTHNRGGGRVLPQDEVEKTAATAKRQGLKTHLDGARLFNAAVALDVEPKVMAEPFDSVMICLSKGLAAPVGSVLVGSREFIQRARRARKMLGGGMRQGGIMAAGGLWALENMVQRLAADHRRAAWLAQALTKLPGVELAKPAETNMVYIRISHPQFTAAQLIQTWAVHGIAAFATDPNTIRLVTHWQVDDEQVETVAEVTRSLLA